MNNDIYITYISLTIINQDMKLRTFFIYNLCLNIIY